MPNKDVPTFSGLILVSGQDRPGITQSLMRTLSQFAVKILDIEQLVIRDRLLLTVLISLDPDHAQAVSDDLALLQDEIGLDIAVDFVQHNDAKAGAETLRVVIVGDGIKPTGLAAVASEIATLGGNITAIKRTAKQPNIAIELELTIPNESIKTVQRALATVAVEHRIDLAVEPGGLIRAAKRIVLLDMDSTLIQQEVIDLLAKHAGKAEVVSQITSKAMSGELDFTQALIQRVQLLAGLDSAIIEKVREEITLMPGAEQLIERLHEQGHKVGVVSGGFTDVIEPLLKSLKLDFYRANQLEIKDGKLTGGLLGQVIDRKAKKNALEEFASLENVSISQSVAVGDGANDLDMIEAAGLGVAFNAKPKVAAAAATTISNYDLSTLLLLMGISS